jgi:hypothetical protein
MASARARAPGSGWMVSRPTCPSEPDRGVQHVSVLHRLPLEEAVGVTLRLGAPVSHGVQHLGRLGRRRTRQELYGVHLEPQLETFVGRPEGPVAAPRHAHGAGQRQPRVPARAQPELTATHADGPVRYHRVEVPRSLTQRVERVQHRAPRGPQRLQLGVRRQVRVQRVEVVAQRLQATHLQLVQRRARRDEEAQLIGGAADSHGVVQPRLPPQRVLCRDNGVGHCPGPARQHETRFVRHPQPVDGHVTPVVFGRGQRVAPVGLAGRAHGREIAARQVAVDHVVRRDQSSRFGRRHQRVGHVGVIAGPERQREGRRAQQSGQAADLHGERRGVQHQVHPVGRRAHLFERVGAWAAHVREAADEAVEGLVVLESVPETPAPGWVVARSNGGVALPAS